MTTTNNKLVPDLRFPEFENSGEWEEKKLEDISYYISSNYSVSSALEQGKYCLYDANKLIGFTNEYLCDRDYISIIKDGSGVGRTRYMNAYNNIIGTMGCIVPNNNINSYFLYSLINNINFKQYIKGATIPHIYYSDYSKHIVFIPPLKEQQKIADFLSSFDELIELEQKKLDKLKEYKKGLLQNLFPKENQKVPDLRFPEFKNSGEWVEKKIKDILDYEQPTNYIVDSDNYFTYGTPVLTANKSFILGYTNEKTGIYSKLPVIIFDDFTTDKKYVSFPFKVKSSAIKILSVKHKKYNTKFIYELISLINFIPQEHKRNYISIYQNIDILIPSFNEQQKIADFLSSVDELIIEQINEVKKLQEYKKGLLQQLFPN